jgi:hypothetical protein
MTSKITPPRRTPPKGTTATKGAATKGAAPAKDKKVRPPVRWNLNTFIFIGVAIVIFAAITFPVWRPFISYDAIDEQFGMLSTELETAIRAQPEAVQQAMLAMASTDLAMAHTIVEAYFRPAIESGETLPSGGIPAEIARGSFTGRDILRTTSGSAAIYAVTGINFLRFENFAATWGPDLRVYFSTSADPLSQGLGANAYEVGRLNINRGAFNIRLAAGLNVYSFQNVVIWDARYQVVYGAAPLTFK